jgi:hypothetical protein
MKQKISDFHLDSEQHWVADLGCGHKQHMRHDPPWMQRPWVLSEEGRRNKLGTELDCKRCNEFGFSVGEAVRQACLKAAGEAYQEAGISGLCEEGRFEIAWDAVRVLDLSQIIEEAIRKRISEV